MDSRTLLQRYNPVSEGSSTNHRSASLFSGYTASNRGNYVSVAVRYITSSKDQVTVKVIKKAVPGRGDSVVDP